MEVHLTPDQEAFIRDAIGSGRIEREEDAVREALALWEERSASGPSFWQRSMTPGRLWTEAKVFRSLKSPCASWPER